LIVFPFTGRDWAEVWLKSENHAAVVKELDRLKKSSKDKKIEDLEEDKYEFASTTAAQLRLVTQRASVQVRPPPASPVPHDAR
jgi:hypothetical protein